MFEFSVAFKYLIPRWRQLSVSIISLISILVIALVVWLITVFFSVTYGLEKNWIQKLIALTAPVRISPTEAYYQSYYYLIDTISAESDYTPKSIGEKYGASLSDPYQIDVDEEPPIHWPSPDLDSEGRLKDPVKLAFSAIDSIKGISGLSANEYEMTITNVKLHLVREPPAASTTLSQASYLSAYDSGNPNLAKAMLPVQKEDVDNLLRFLAEDPHTPQDHSIVDEEEDSYVQELALLQPKAAHTSSLHKLRPLLNSVKITSFLAERDDLPASLRLLPDNCRLEVCALKVGKQIHSLYLPFEPASWNAIPPGRMHERVQPIPAIIEKKNEQLTVTLQGGQIVDIPPETPLILDVKFTVQGSPDLAFLDQANSLDEIPIQARIHTQGVLLSGTIPWKNLKINSFEIQEPSENGFWIFKNSMPASLPSDSLVGDAVLLPKSYRAAGALIGDRGYLSYQTPTASSVQEQRVPIYVAGFYDPGILPLGGKIVLANPYIISMIRSAYPADHSPLSNGINVRMDNLEDAEAVKKMLEASFREKGIDPYWKIETFREFEFTKDFLQQLRSEKNLFSLISIIVIIVACSNIISMLIILVNNKKIEIGILRSIGATSRSIALIFGTCGVLMGFAGSFLGLSAAILTLNHLDTLIHVLSKAQGFDLFNPVYYGETLPNQISYEALGFVMAATALISLIAGVIPAVKAALMRPAAILRAE